MNDSAQAFGLHTSLSRPGPSPPALVAWALRSAPGQVHARPPGQVHARPGPRRGHWGRSHRDGRSPTLQAAWSVCEGPTGLSIAGGRGVSKGWPVGRSWAPEEGTRVKEPPARAPTPVCESRARSPTPRPAWAAGVTDPVPGLCVSLTAKPQVLPWARPRPMALHTAPSQPCEVSPPPRRGGGPDRRAELGLKSRQTPGPLLQPPVHLTAKQPQDPILSSGPPGWGLAPSLARSGAHGKWAWSPSTPPLRMGWVSCARSSSWPFKNNLRTGSEHSPAWV